MAQKSLIENSPSIPKTKTMVKATKYALLIVLTALGISVMAQRGSPRATNTTSSRNANTNAFVIGRSGTESAGYRARF